MSPYRGAGGGRCAMCGWTGVLGGSWGQGTPTLGVGWLAAPDEVVAAVCAHRSSTGMRPSPAGQRALTALAMSGDLARHLRRVRRELLARRDLLVGALRAAALPVRGDQAGAHLVIALPSMGAERTASRRAAGEGLLLDGLERCHDGPPGCHGVTLGYAAPSSRSALAAALPGLTALLTASRQQRHNRRITGSRVPP